MSNLNLGIQVAQMTVINDTVVKSLSQAANY